MAKGKPKDEGDVDKYLEFALALTNGHGRRIIYRGRKGCADWLVGFPVNRLYLVELKHPGNEKRGHGEIRKHQEIDATEWERVGAIKVYLWNDKMIDDWIKKVC